MNSVLNWIKSLYGCLKIITKLMKEVILLKFVFTKDSQMVKSAVLLLTAKVYEDINDVPNIGNLREMVMEVMMG